MVALGLPDEMDVRKAEKFTYLRQQLKVTDINVTIENVQRKIAERLASGNEFSHHADHFQRGMRSLNATVVFRVETAGPGLLPVIQQEHLMDNR